MLALEMWRKSLKPRTSPGKQWTKPIDVGEEGNKRVKGNHVWS